MSRKGTLPIQRHRTIVLWICIMAVFIAELLVYTWSRLQCIQIGYAISAETEKYSERIAVQKNLRIELARLKSPKRIAKIAMERSGLIPPTPEQVISIP